MHSRLNQLPVGPGCELRGLWATAVGMILAALFGVSAAADEWPQLLGPQRTGISPETGLLNEWPPTGPQELWRAPGGVGMSGIAVGQGLAVTLVQTDGRQWVVAWNAEDGSPQWRTDIAPEYRNAMGDGPRATPAFAGNSIFVFSGEGILAALDRKDGSVQWSRNVVADLQGEIADYGMACSPLVVDGRVVVIVGAPQATVAAFDVRSGETAWTAGDDPAGYSSPALLELQGGRQVVVSSGTSVMGLSPSAGTILWRHPFETNYNCNIVTPLAFDGGVFVSAGENHGSALLRLERHGEQFDVREAWTSPGSKSVLRNEWQTSILDDGNLYGFDNVGAAGPVTHFTCIDAKTGARRWQQLRFGKGNAIAADGKLFMTTIDGELVVARLNPDHYEELGRAGVLGFTRQAPSLANGRLYLRDDQDVVCLDVRAQ